MMDVFTQFIKNPIPYEWEAGTKKQDRKAGKRDDIGKILRYMGKKRMAGFYLRRSDFRKYQLWGMGYAFEISSHQWSEFRKCVPLNTRNS